METAIGWRVELWKLGMARKAHEDFPPEQFRSAMAYGEHAQLRHGFSHVAIAPIFPPDRIRGIDNAECATDCPVCFPRPQYPSNATVGLPRDYARFFPV